MVKQGFQTTGSGNGLARGMPFLQGALHRPEGALVAGEAEEDGRIAVVYNHGDTPPEITIAETAGRVQTVMADGVAVAIVARADGPGLTTDDVLLVERFVGGCA
jgi:hypothetical protein